MLSTARRGPLTHQWQERPLDELKGKLVQTYQLTRSALNYLSVSVFTYLLIMDCFFSRTSINTLAAQSSIIVLSATYA